jgi:hypothetical protein
MKTKKWVTYTLAVLLTLIVLVAVGFAGFRVGMMQNVSLAGNMPFIGHMRGFDNDTNKQGNNNANGQQGFGNPHNFGNQRGFDDQRGFNQRGGFGRGGGRGGFFSPIFGLIKLVVLGALLWLGYKLVKNSGWKLVKTESASAAPVAAVSTPVQAESAPASEGEEKKE